MIDLAQTPFASKAALLLDLHHALNDSGVPLLLGGGFGLLLKREAMIASSPALVFSTAIPAARSTEDFDAFLPIEVLADATKVGHIRESLAALGYQVLDSARYWQFAHPETRMKIDLLARPPVEAESDQVRVDDRRVSPLAKGSQINARKTIEALAVEDSPQEIVLAGSRSDGAAYRATIFVPHTYAFWLMKLFAFRDNEELQENRRTDWSLYAQKHALDLYTLATLLSVEEYDQFPELRARYGDHTAVQEAGRIVGHHFANDTAPGAIRIREHGDFPREENVLGDFLVLLQETFPAPF